jgi:outer membrane protein OmpA-like peptidoglycan-associated protein
MIDPFIDADTGDITRSSIEIEQAFAETFAKRPKDFSLVAINPDTLQKATYIVTGIIRHEPYGATKYRIYHLFASVVEIKTGIVIANADSWVSDKAIDNAPVAIYQNSPMYIKDSVMEMKIQTAQANPGSPCAPGYLQSLQSLSLSQEASLEYERGNYSQAISLFVLSLAQPGGANMKNQLGLYQAYYRSGDFENASTAFYNMFALAADENRISVKFLFSVNSVNFINDPDLIRQYTMWIEQASHYFSRSRKCLTIVGHSSHTGDEAYNVKLSQARAQRIDYLMRGIDPALAPHIRTIGRGYAENIIGSGTDDAQDMVDRRVEFRLNGCP